MWRPRCRGGARRGRLAFLLLALAAAVGCERAPDRPNVLLVTLDTTRADHLSTYGYDRPTSPFLTELAAEGALFRRAYAAAPATAPTHATMFTALSPLTHRVVRNAVALGAQHVTLAELLAAAGYQTAAVVSSFVLNAKFGLDQGFGSYDDRFERGGESISWRRWEGQDVTGAFDRRANATTTRALTWLRDERDGEPFFLFVHYFDPHDPYEPPASYRGRFADPAIADPNLRREIANYDGEIAFADDQLRRLCAGLADLGLADDTLVIVVGDHGEGLWQRGYQYHGAHIYEEAVRVPLVVRWPGRIPAGLVGGPPVTVADLLPTVCELVDVPTDDLVLHGRSLAPYLRDGATLDDRPVFLYRIPYEPHAEFGVWVDGEKHAVRLGRWKYLASETEDTTELYDLQADPGELVDQAAAEPAVAADMARLLADWRSAVTRPDSLTIRPELSPADLEKLRSLGYVR